MMPLQGLEKVVAERDISKKEISDHLNVSPVTVWRWETGKRSVSSDVLIKLADFLHCSIDDLLGRNPTPQVRKAV